MRKGPHPLPVHLGMIAANMQGIQQYASDAQTSQFKLSEGDAVKMMRGIQLYQAHGFARADMPTQEVWRDGAVTMHKIPSDTPSDLAPILFVPSLINGAEILDISADKSMVRWFAAQGRDVYLLDWGALMQGADRDLTMNHLLHDKLCAAILHVSEGAGRPIDVLGYCMGGTLSIVACAMLSRHIRRIVLLAAPWNFHTPKYELARHVRIWSHSVTPVIKARGCLPAEWVQSLFASIDPKGSAQKFMRFASMDQGGSDAQLFVAVEDWLNDGADLPGAIAESCIKDWFLNNEPMQNSCLDADTPFDLDMLEQKVLLVASTQDQLVPKAAAFDIAQSLSNAKCDTIELSCGHIGMIVGRRAVPDIWAPIVQWLSQE